MKKEKIFQELDEKLFQFCENLTPKQKLFFVEFYLNKKAKEFIFYKEILKDNNE